MRAKEQQFAELENQFQQSRAVSRYMENCLVNSDRKFQLGNQGHQPELEFLMPTRPKTSPVQTTAKRCNSMRTRSTTTSTSTDPQNQFVLKLKPLLKKWPNDKGREN